MVGDPHQLVPLRTLPSTLWLKGCVDRYVGFCALIAAAPLLLVLMWMVKRDSRGPALFAQTRAGLGGKPFTLYKLRTMRTDVDPFGDSPNTAHDPRMTGLGRWLRETSLDELPQLLNVVRGEMSLVGPRPLYVQQMAEWTPRQRSRLQVQPGLTGFSQINGRASITIEEKLEWDVRYVAAFGLRTDFYVILRTVSVFWRPSGIYQTDYSTARKHRTATSG